MSQEATIGEVPLGTSREFFDSLSNEGQQPAIISQTLASVCCEIGSSKQFLILGWLPDGCQEHSHRSDEKTHLGKRTGTPEAQQGQAAKLGRRLKLDRPRLSLNAL